MCTCFAGSDAARKIDLAMEALSWYGDHIPIMILMTGHGGNSKSAKTLLRENVFGNLHATVDPKCFQTLDEFRIQGKFQ